MEDFISERLYHLRQIKGVSARNMSLSIGFNHGYISLIENQKTLPAMQSFFYICEYLKVTPQEFFDMKNVHPERAREVIAGISRLDDLSLFHLGGIVKALSKPKSGSAG